MNTLNWDVLKFKYIFKKRVKEIISEVLTQKNEG
jgi:hypothetical protein